MTKFLSKEDLEKLTTKRLLAYKNSLMKVPEEPNWDESANQRISKISPEWKKQYHLVKSVLATRENVQK